MTAGWWLTDLTGPRALEMLQEEDKRLKRATQVPLLSRLMLGLSSAAFREEIRRLSVITLLEKDKV
jgi:hypothetical protein